MQTLYRAARYVLPVAFLGYGAFVNYALLTEGRLAVDLTDRPLSGGLTAQVDEVYKKGLPLRDDAVGLIGAMRYSLMGEGRKGVIVARDGWLFTTEEATAMVEPMAEPVARIAAIRDQLAAMGVTLVMAPLPAKSDLEADHAGWPDLSAAQARRHADFLAALEAAGVTAVDLRPDLLAAAGSGQAFFATDTHWTVEGAAVAAQSLARGLRDLGLAPEPKAYHAEAAPEEGFTGDLVSFVTTPGMAPLLGLKAEAVTPLRAVAAEDDLTGGDLFGGPAAGGIALVGTSYSANPRWSFADSLILALGADVVNHAEQGLGPVKPMRAMLDDPAFAAAPPSLVIWEFPVRYLADPRIWDKAEPGHGA